MMPIADALALLGFYVLAITELLFRPMFAQKLCRPSYAISVGCVSAMSGGSVKRAKHILQGQ